MRKKETILIIIFAIIFFLAKIFLGNYLSTSGKQVEEVKARSEFLAKENLSLEEEIVGLSSLAKISLEAEKLGFKKTTIVSLTPEIPVALR